MIGLDLISPTFFSFIFPRIISPIIYTKSNQKLYKKKVDNIFFDDYILSSDIQPYTYRYRSSDYESLSLTSNMDRHSDKEIGQKTDDGSLS